MNLDTWKKKVKDMLIRCCKDSGKANDQFIDAAVELLNRATEDYRELYPEEVYVVESAAHFSNCPVLEGKATRCNCSD